MDTDRSNEDDYILMCGDNKDDKMPHVRVQMNELPAQMIIDTRASLDILDEVMFAKIQQKKKIELTGATT